MRLHTPYSFGVSINVPFDVAERRVREELAREGFGVVTEIDVKQTFKKKLGREFRDYVILGTCNPALAWEAFDSEINVGTLLPCNVVVYRGDDGKTVVMAMDPVAALIATGATGLTEVARMVRSSMKRVLGALTN